MKVKLEYRISKGNYKFDIEISKFDNHDISKFKGNLISTVKETLKWNCKWKFEFDDMCSILCLVLLARVYLYIFSEDHVSTPSTCSLRMFARNSTMVCTRPPTHPPTLMAQPLVVAHGEGAMAIQSAWSSSDESPGRHEPSITTQVRKRHHI